MTTTEETSTPTTRRRRTRRASTTSAARRTRRPSVSGTDLLAQLTAQVDRLIAENRDLKRAIARLERTPAGPALGQAARALSGLLGG